MQNQLNVQVMQGMIADINTLGRDNWNAIHFAASNGHLETVKFLAS